MCWRHGSRSISCRLFWSRRHYFCGWCGFRNYKIIRFEVNILISSMRGFYKRFFRTFGRGPFSTFKLTPDRALNWISLKFSLEGNAILISTNGQSLKGKITKILLIEFWIICLVVDAFDGTTRALLGGHKNTRKLNLKGKNLEILYLPS